MKRLCRMVMLVAVCVYSFFLKCQFAQAEGIRCDLTETGTLFIRGSGELQFSDIPDSLAKSNKIKEIVVCEGITVLGERAFVHFYTYETKKLKIIILPNSLTEIGDSCFDDLSYVEEIRMGGKIRKIGKEAFNGMTRLRTVTLPDSVESIGDRAFNSCKRLKKLLIPASLKSWKKNITRKCPMLKKVENHSGLICVVDDCKGNKFWRVKGKRVSALSPGSTGKAMGKKIPIVYNLVGGKKTGKLPDYYVYGTRVRVPLHVSKKGYTPVGWYWEGKENAEGDCVQWKDMVFYIGSDYEKVRLTPLMFKYKTRSDKPGEVVVTIGDDEAQREIWYGIYEVRYSKNRDMSGAQRCFLEPGKFLYRRRIKGLERGGTYYFQFRPWADNESGPTIWVGKRKVEVKV